MTAWIIAALGGSAGLTLLVARAALGGAVSHAVKRYLNRRSAQRCPNAHKGWEKHGRD